ncbi:dTDP-glucose 4,6-dehydratase [Patescibacteria group bacterium]
MTYTPKSILVTGGAGFIGSNFIRYMLQKYPEVSIINLDKLTYAGNLENLQDIEGDARYNFVKGDIADSKLLDEILPKVDSIINFAAETHVDRSIDGGEDFIMTDVLGTFRLLEGVRKHSIKRFLQISTDEVYGDIPAGQTSKETDSLKPSSPYSASKAGGDFQVIAAHRTHDLPTLITRCTNNYGPNQYPEKLIPLFITNIIEGLELPIYGDGQQVRDWIYVDDHCEAVDLVLREGQLGEIYNVGANQDPEITNMMITDSIIKELGKGEELKKFVDDRPGHDRRYAVDTDKIEALGWNRRTDFAEGIKKTVQWYTEHPSWWQKIKSGEFKKYYLEQYKAR